MKISALHLNLLAAEESASDAAGQNKFALPIAAGAFLAGCIVWGLIVGLRLVFAQGEVDELRAQVKAHEMQNAETENLRRSCNDLAAEVEQYAYYSHGRQQRGLLLKRLAGAIPAGVTLTSLSIPPPPEQNLSAPPGVALPPQAGPTSSVERVELRLTGLAKNEREVLNLMENLKAPGFTNLLCIVDRSVNPVDESPRVLAFRQEETRDPSASRARGIFFDIVYLINPREFVK